MDVKEENICRLCLKVAENGYKIVDEITRKTLGFLLLSVNLDIIKDPIICKECTEVAEKCFIFRSVFINTKKIVISFESKAMFESEDVLKHERHVESVDDGLICRFCSKYLSGCNYVLLDTLMTEMKFAGMLPTLFSEMDFNIIKNAIVCTSCEQSFECYIKFVENCLDVEDKIFKYIQNEGIHSFAQVNLSNVLRFLFENTSELDDTQIKQEKDALEDMSDAHCEAYEDELIKDEVLDTKDEELNFNESSMAMSKLDESCGLKTRKSPKAPTHNRSCSPTVAAYRKCMCDTVHHCGIESDMQSNIISSETKMAYQTKCKVDREINRMSSTKNISKVQIFKCSLCTYQAKEKSKVKRHMLIHKDIKEVEIHKCSMCTFETKHKDSLKTRILMHKDIAEVLLKCSMCTFETKYKSNLRKHMCIHKDFTEVKMYKCSMCTFQTKEKSSLKRHMVTHKDIREVEMYKCSMCIYETKQKYSLKRHELIHKNITEVEMYKCSMCTFQAKQKGYLEKHMLIHKNITEVEMYKCSMCTYETKRKGNLKTHVLIHKDTTEVEIYKCSMCTFKAKQMSNLRKHMFFHKDITEGEMLRCTVCSYKTKQKYNLKSHVLIHKTIPEVEMYKCSMCTYETKHKGNFKSHVLIHKDVAELEMYKCSMCTYQAKQKSNLRKHMLIHKDITDVEMYKCSVCSYETKRKGNLKSHVLIHKDITEVEVYNCPKCTYETKRKAYIKRHKCKSQRTRGNS